jgi:hypothetical protein
MFELRSGVLSVESRVQGGVAGTQARPRIFRGMVPAKEIRNP